MFQYNILRELIELEPLGVLTPHVPGALVKDHVSRTPPFERIMQAKKRPIMYLPTQADNCVNR